MRRMRKHFAQHLGVSPRGARQGFTLLEMLITLVVLGILAAVVYPNLSSYVKKGRRSEAYNSLNAVQQAQERHRANNSSYASSLTDATNADPPGLGFASTSSATGLYTLSLDSVSATGYSVIATAVSGKSQADDSGCQQLRIRSASGSLFYGSAAGDGAFTESTNNKCWSR